MVPKSYHEKDSSDRSKDKDIQKPTVKKSYSSSSQTRSEPVPRTPQLHRADTQQLEKIEKGSNSQVNNHFADSSANTDSSNDKAIIFKEVDADQYMSRREMTAFQERVNAITVLPPAFLCLLFLLSGIWIDEAWKEEIGSDMKLNSSVQYIDDSGCISSQWFPNLHALPPMPVVAVLVGVFLHFPFSFIYHWHYAHRLPPGFARTNHWSRRMDQAMIHAGSTFQAYATSGRLDFFFVNLLFNMDSVWCLFQPRVSPRRNQFRLFIAQLGYSIPILSRGDVRRFFELWLVLGFCGWLFLVYPIGGWSHSVFHLSLTGVPLLLIACAVDLPESQGQLKTAARCAIIGEQRLYP